MLSQGIHILSHVEYDFKQLTVSLVNYMSGKLEKKCVFGIVLTGSTT